MEPPRFFVLQLHGEGSSLDGVSRARRGRAKADLPKPKPHGGFGDLAAGRARADKRGFCVRVFDFGLTARDVVGRSAYPWVRSVPAPTRAFAPPVESVAARHDIHW